MKESLLDYGTNFITQDNKLINNELQKYNKTQKYFVNFLYLVFILFSMKFFKKLILYQTKKKKFN